METKKRSLEAGSSDEPERTSKVPRHLPNVDELMKTEKFQFEGDGNFLSHKITDLFFNGQLNNFLEATMTLNEKFVSNPLFKTSGSVNTSTSFKLFEFFPLFIEFRNFADGKTPEELIKVLDVKPEHRIKMGIFKLQCQNICKEILKNLIKKTDVQTEYDPPLKDSRGQIIIGYGQVAQILENDDSDSILSKLGESYLAVQYSKYIGFIETENNQKLPVYSADPSFAQKPYSERGLEILHQIRKFNSSGKPALGVEHKYITLNDLFKYFATRLQSRKALEVLSKIFKMKWEEIVER